LVSAVRSSELEAKPVLRVAIIAGWLVTALCCAPALAQRVNIPATTFAPQNPASYPPSLNAPPPSGATLGAPSFDPYAIAPTSAPSAYSPPFTPQYGAPAYAPPTYAAPPYGAPPAVAPTFGQPTYGAPPMYAPLPQNPTTQFPSGAWSEDIGRVDPYQQGTPLRLFQNIRFRHTYLSRLGQEEGLGINDSEIATTAAFPRFLFTTQPIYISPGFIFSQWDGPASPPADLPPRAYSAYLDFDYTTNPAYRFGADLHVRTGVYSDFNAINTNSFRLSGRGLGTFQMTPALQLKLGVEYINRNDIKLLPAGGFLYVPNPQTRLDVYFPKPKLAVYLTTLGNTEIWGYLAGEYGGGAWTIERAGTGQDERIDINDIRAIVGTEFMNSRSLKGFVEAGYVFNREVVYVARPQDSFDPDSTFMLRGGVAY
jgi:hypothetical protein